MNQVTVKLAWKLMSFSRLVHKDHHHGNERCDRQSMLKTSHALMVLALLRFCLPRKQVGFEKADVQHRSFARAQNC